MLNASWRKAEKFEDIVKLQVEKTQLLRVLLNERKNELGKNKI